MMGCPGCGNDPVRPASIRNCRIVIERLATGLTARAGPPHAPMDGYPTPLMARGSSV